MIKLFVNYFRRQVLRINQQILGRDGQPLRDTYGALIEPDGNKDFAFRRIDNNKINNMKVSDALRTLIKTNTTLDAVVDIHQTFAVRNYVLITRDNETDNEVNERARVQIQDWIDTAFGGVKSFRGMLKQMAYYRLVEGGIALLITYDPDSLRPKINVLSPFSLVYTYKEEGDQKYLVIGKKIKHNEIEVYYDESRPDAENMNFVYVPSNLRGDQVFGSSQMATILRPAYNRQRLSEQLGDYLEKRIYPKIFYWMDLTRLFGNRDISTDQISKFATDGSTSLKAKIRQAEGEPSKEGESAPKDLVGSAPVGTTEVSGVSKSKLDGLEVMLEVLEPEIMRGSRVPRILLGGRQGQSLIGSNESDTEWETFSFRNADSATDISEAITRALIPVRLNLGIDVFVGVDVTYDNLRLKRIEAEVINLQLDSYEKLINMGVATPEYIASKVSEHSTDFSDLEYVPIEEPQEPANNPQDNA